METDKISIVIFSSGNQVSIAQTLKDKLEKCNYDCATWKTIFKKNDETAKYYALMPILLKKIPTFDFAIIIGAADDNVEINKNGEILRSPSMRDNLIFEIGLSVMALGQERTILIADKKIRFIDDFTGVKGINSELTPSSLGIKCITFEDIKRIEDEKELDRVVDELHSYILSIQDDFMPIVIGASCSTAIGYYHNCVEKFITRFKPKDNEYSKAVFTICIPTILNSNTYKKISKYYPNQYSTYELPEINGERKLSFYVKIENDTLYVMDIPTTIGTSYETAVKILSIDGADKDDDNDKKRFLRKELSIFHKTILKLIDGKGTANVEIKVEKIVLNDIL